VSRDSLGHDPLGLDPVSAVSQISSVSKSREAIHFLKQGIVVRGVYICPDRDGPLGDPPPVVSDDGTPITLEARRAIAAARAKFVVAPFGEVKTGEFASDLTDRQTEQLGTSAQKEIMKMPEMQLLPTRELKIEITE
jgi:hypothetical protein